MLLLTWHPRARCCLPPVIPELAAAVKTTEIQVGAFTREQSLELLGRCTGLDPAALPGTAVALCAHVGDLPMSVALAGGVASCGRPFHDALSAIKRTPARAGADQGTGPGPGPRPSGRSPGRPDLVPCDRSRYSGSTLAEADQRRYEQLAVFASRGPFPRDAAWALWQPGLPDTGVDDLLAELLLTGHCLPAAVRVSTRRTTCSTTFS